ncbi:non-ribosomal peptide synthetase [Streptomyces sp. NPDC054932]
MSDIQRLTGLPDKEKRELLVQALRENSGQGRASARSLPTVEPAPQERYQPFPLTPLQQAYWLGRGDDFLLGNVGSHVYFEVDTPRLDLERCTAALQQVIARHDMLRTVFRPDGRQEVLRSVPPYRLGVSDVRDVPADEAEEQLEAVRERMSGQVFAAERWPLFEMHAACLDDRRTRLYFSIDLLICDLRSFQVLLDEWLQLYTNPGAVLPPLELSFRDYVLAERAWEDSDTYRRSREYWRNRIPGLAPAPELPVIKPLSDVSKPSFVRHSTTLEPEVWSRLKQRAKKARLTPATVLLAAFAEVLSVWSKSPRFTLNLILFNRLPVHPQVNDVIGEFTSMILLGVDNSGPDSFEARATRMQEQLWDDLDHRHFHGVNVLRELARSQGSAHGATMPVVFTCDVVHDFMAPEKATTSSMGDFVYGLSQTPQVSLDHQAFERGGALVLNWDAVEELFPAGLVSDMCEAEVRLLHRLLEDEAWWQAAPCRPPTAQLEQRNAINATSRPMADELLQAGFIRQASQRPGQPAVVTADRTLDYAELSRRSERVARRLRGLGARPGTLVAVVMEKGWEQIVSVLGILRSGAAYLPIDPDLPGERLRFLLEDGQVQLALTQPWLRERLGWPEGIELLSVDGEDDPGDDAGDDAGGDPLEPVQRPDDLAYVIYTSGSTGSPKGVMIDHRSALNTIDDINRRFEVGPHDRVLALSSLSFDLSVYDIFGLLAAGGTIVMPEAAASVDPSRWIELMAREEVTVWNSVPILLEMLVQHVGAQGGGLPDALRLAMLSGDWIPVALPDRIKSLGRDVRVVGLGGATEASIWSILYPIDAVGPEWKSIPYGKPMANQRFHVLDERLEPCPVWVPGHLYIGGAGLARGYWRDEQKTSVGFITHPRTGERLYRTGDLGRYLPDGNIEFFGREDTQVKIRGHRIELGEIEAAAREHPHVRDVVVTATGGDRNNKRLVAYVTGNRDLADAGGADELRGFLREKLPDYMVPTATVFLPELPMTANGKIDRKALSEHAPAAPSPSPSRHESPGMTAGATAEVIGKIVAEVLEVEEVSPADELMALGIDSLDIIRIASRLNEVFGFRPAMADIFRLTTVAALAAYYDEHQPQDAAAEGGAIVGAGTSIEAVPSSFELLLDPGEREEFKRGRPGIRGPCSEAPEVSVRLPELPDETLGAKCAQRRSHHQFSELSVPFDRLGDLLGCLRELRGDTTPRHLYASAGGIYPVQTYLHVKRDRVEGLAEGVYYYHPDHRLVVISADVPLHRGIHLPVNRSVFDEAAFSVFLIGRIGAVAPIYGEASMRFALIEAGLISQLLETTAPAAQLGLCQIGSLDFASIRSAFALEEDDVFLHALVGGGAVPPPGREEGLL